MINKIQLACMLRTYRTCNPTMEFSKYKLINKLLSGVTLLRVISGITLTQLIYTHTHTHTPSSKDHLEVTLALTLGG